MGRLICIAVLLSLLAAGCVTVSEEEAYSSAEIENQELMPYEDDLTQGLGE